MIFSRELFDQLEKNHGLINWIIPMPFCNNGSGCSDLLEALIEVHPTEEIEEIFGLEPDLNIETPKEMIDRLWEKDVNGLLMEISLAQREGYLILPGIRIIKHLYGETTNELETKTIEWIESQVGEQQQ